MNTLGVSLSAWNIAEKTTLITGATSGIGRAAARELLRKGAKILFTSRTKEQGELCQKELIQETGNTNVSCIISDLASLASIREAALSIAKHYPKLHVLINNAGVMPATREESKDGIELNMAVNYFAPVLLTRLLLPLLTKNIPARIINVASSLHREGTIDLQNLIENGAFDRYRSYAASKLALVLFTRQLAKELAGTEVTVNTVHPGWINTKLARGVMGDRSILKQWFVQLSKMHTPEDGARGMVRLASDPALEGITGQYLGLNGFTDPSPSAKDDSLAQQLSEKTLSLLTLYLK